MARPFIRILVLFHSTVLIPTGRRYTSSIPHCCAVSLTYASKTTQVITFLLKRNGAFAFYLHVWILLEDLSTIHEDIWGIRSHFKCTGLVIFALQVYAPVEKLICLLT
jgi:hypothetical protein